MLQAIGPLFSSDAVRSALSQQATSRSKQQQSKVRPGSILQIAAHQAEDTSNCQYAQVVTDKQGQGECRAEKKTDPRQAAPAAGGTGWLPRSCLWPPLTPHQTEAARHLQRDKECLTLGPHKPGAGTEISCLPPASWPVDGKTTAAGAFVGSFATRRHQSSQRLQCMTTVCGKHTGSEEDPSRGP